MRYDLTSGDDVVTGTSDSDFTAGLHSPQRFHSGFARPTAVSQRFVSAPRWRFLSGFARPTEVSQQVFTTLVTVSRRVYTRR